MRDGLQTPAGPFIDGRTHIQQNVEFQLRGAGTGPDPFDEPFVVGVSGQGGACWGPDELGYTNYVYAGFHRYEPGGDRLMLDAFRPFEQNYIYANLVFSLTNDSSNGVLWGCPFIGMDALFDFWCIPNTVFQTYAFASSRSTNAPPALVPPATTRWISGMPQTFGGDNWPPYTVPVGFKNVWGLSLQSALAAGTAEPFCHSAWINY